MNDLIKCNYCGNYARWCYLPSSENFTEAERYCCDDHVPRGCECNQEFEPIDGNRDNLDDSNWRELPEPLDEKGRRYPCIEWYYQVDGYIEVIENEPYEQER